MEAEEFLNSVTDCLDGGGYSTTVVTYEDAITYANQRVIEELECLKENYTELIEWQGGSDIFIPIRAVQMIIDELKQE